MSKFYCNKCKEEVTLQDGKCPKCKTNWENIINDNISKNVEPIDVYARAIKGDSEEFSEITERDIRENINFFINWGVAVKIFMIIIGIIIAINSIISIGPTGGQSLFMLIYAISCVFAGIIFENILNWFAYMLYTNMKKNNKENK